LAIQRQLPHKRFDTTQGYIRGGELFKKNAAGMAAYECAIPSWRSEAIRRLVELG
jgi:hypothetical protein